MLRHVTQGFSYPDSKCVYRNPQPEKGRGCVEDI